MATSCVAASRWGVAADPEQPEIGSARRETRNGYDNQPAHKIILNMIFIITHKIISDIIITNSV
jgi:hypothetical protein